MSRTARSVGCDFYAIGACRLLFELALEFNFCTLAEFSFGGCAGVDVPIIAWWSGLFSMPKRRSSSLALSSITLAANPKRLRTGCAVPDEFCKFKGRLA
jgi:hypothetical protein